jgi:hypothetical protein
LDGVTWNFKDSGAKNALWSIAWMGTQLVAVGSNGIILTSPQDKSNQIASHLISHNSLILRRTSSHLYAAIPISMYGQSLSATIYSASGNTMSKVMGIGSNAELEFSLDGMAQSQNFIEVKSKIEKVVKPIFIMQ